MAIFIKAQSTKQKAQRWNTKRDALRPFLYEFRNKEIFLAL